MTPAIDEDRLRRESGEIEQLLADLRELVSGPAWDRLEDVLGRIVRLYGAGLAHALVDAHAAGADPDALAATVASDELLASLLVLHGLHPHSVRDRIERALASIRSELGATQGDLAIATITDDGCATLTAATQLGRGAMSARVVEGVIRRAVECAAPELASVRIEGLEPADASLVQIRGRRQAS